MSLIKTIKNAFIESIDSLLDDYINEKIANAIKEKNMDLLHENNKTISMYQLINSTKFGDLKPIPIHYVFNKTGDCYYFLSDKLYKLKVDTSYKIEKGMPNSITIYSSTNTNKDSLKIGFRNLSIIAMTVDIEIDIIYIYYVIGSTTHGIYRFDCSSGICTLAYTFSNPNNYFKSGQTLSMCVDGGGNLLIANYETSKIWKLLIGANNTFTSINEITVSITTVSITTGSITTVSIKNPYICSNKDYTIYSTNTTNDQYQIGELNFNDDDKTYKYVIKCNENSGLKQPKYLISDYANNNLYCINTITNELVGIFAKSINFTISDSQTNFNTKQTDTTVYNTSNIQFDYCLYPSNSILNNNINFNSSDETPVFVSAASNSGYFVGTNKVYNRKTTSKYYTLAPFTPIILQNFNSKFTPIKIGVYNNVINLNNYSYVISTSVSAISNQELKLNFDSSNVLSSA